MRQGLVLSIIISIGFCASVPAAGEEVLATWISGSDIGNQPGVYGTKGVADPNNVPGSRDGSISWTDTAGNLWLFGGNQFPGFGFFNDLWKFDGTNWTWESGSDLINQPGIYGTKGIADPNNVPGSRYESVSWTDSSGDLWLFGGYGYDGDGNRSRLNDLWKYDISANTWTWIGGSDVGGELGVYGTKGVADPNNIPGARYRSISWIDSEGNFWLFGGDTPYFYRNDLWKYDVSANTWTWISGADSGLNEYGVYGIKGIADPNNIPGARFNSISWIDSADNLWLLGGLGYDGDGNRSRLNDLWKFDGVNWTWVSGSDTVHQLGIYGTQGVADANNVPGARHSGVSWVDGAGDLWLLGGAGFNGIGDYSPLNDLWKYDVSDNIWTWVSGSNTAWPDGFYGTKGVAGAANIPSGRDHSISWEDRAGNFWLFGGRGVNRTDNYDSLNDLWKFELNRVDLVDFSVFAAAWQSDDTPTANWNPDCDFDGDGVIDLDDLIEFVEEWLE